MPEPPQWLTIVWGRKKPRDEEESSNILAVAYFAAKHVESNVVEINIRSYANDFASFTGERVEDDVYFTVCYKTRDQVQQGTHTTMHVHIVNGSVVPFKVSCVTPNNWTKNDDEENRQGNPCWDHSKPRVLTSRATLDELVVRFAVHGMDQNPRRQAGMKRGDDG